MDRDKTSGALAFTTHQTTPSQQCRLITAMDQKREVALSVRPGLWWVLSMFLLSEALAQNRVQALVPEDSASETMCKTINFLTLGVFIYKFKLMLISCFIAVGTQN